MKKPSLIAMIVVVLAVFFWVWPTVNTAPRKYAAPETASWQLSDPETNAVTRWVEVGKTYKISAHFHASRGSKFTTRSPADVVTIDNELGEITFHQQGVPTICPPAHLREPCRVFIAESAPEFAGH